MTWTVGIFGDDQYFPEMPAFEDSFYLDVKNALDALYDYLLNGMSVINDIFLLLPEIISVYLPSGMQINVALKVDNHFTLIDFRLPELERTETIINWGLWPVPITRLHFNLYPWQSWWTNFTGFKPFQDVVLKENCYFRRNGATVMKDYMLSDLLYDIGAFGLFSFILGILAKYGFTFAKDMYQQYYNAVSTANDVITQNALGSLITPSTSDLNDPTKFVNTLTSVNDVLTRVKAFYRGAYV